MHNAAETTFWDNGGMSRRLSTPPRKLRHHWYLSEWAEQAGKTQADAVRDLGWNKSTASLLWSGVQRYNQDLLDEVSAWLNVRPFELLLPVKEAMSIRQMRSSALEIAASNADVPEVAHSQDALRRATR